MFDTNKTTLTIENQELEIKELSVKEFNDILNLSEEEQGYHMISKSIVSHEITPEEVQNFPNRIASHLLQEVLKFNGVVELGN